MDEDKPEVEQPSNGIPIPRKVTSQLGKLHYRPDATRLGVRVNGVERNDLIGYDLDRMTIRSRNSAIDVPVSQIEPYWRYPETRQMRRARERWEKK